MMGGWVNGEMRLYKYKIYFIISCIFSKHQIKAEIYKTYIPQMITLFFFSIIQPLSPKEHTEDKS